MTLALSDQQKSSQDIYNGLTTSSSPLVSASPSSVLMPGEPEDTERLIQAIQNSLKCAIENLERNRSRDKPEEPIIISTGIRAIFKTFTFTLTSLPHSSDTGYEKGFPVTFKIVGRRKLEIITPEKLIGFSTNLYFVINVLKELFESSLVDLNGHIGQTCTVDQVDDPGQTHGVDPFTKGETVAIRRTGKYFTIAKVCVQPVAKEEGGEAGQICVEVSKDQMKMVKNDVNVVKHNIPRRYLVELDPESLKTVSRQKIEEVLTKIQNKPH